MSNIKFLRDGRYLTVSQMKEYNAKKQAEADKVSKMQKSGDENVNSTEAELKAKKDAEKAELKAKKDAEKAELKAKKDAEKAEVKN